LKRSAGHRDDEHDRCCCEHLVTTHCSRDEAGVVYEGLQLDQRLLIVALAQLDVIGDAMPGTRSMSCGSRCSAWSSCCSMAERTIRSDPTPGFPMYEKITKGEIKLTSDKVPVVFDDFYEQEVDHSRQAISGGAVFSRSW
jgi:hypothetical protein